MKEQVVEDQLRSSDYSASCSLLYFFDQRRLNSSIKEHIGEIFYLISMSTPVFVSNQKVHGKPHTYLICLYPVISSVNPSESDTKNTAKQKKYFPRDYEDTQKVPESSFQEKPPENLFQVTVPRYDFCSKKSDTSGSLSESFDIITIKFQQDRNTLVIACENVSDFKNVISNSQSTVVLIKNWSKAGSIKVKLGPHSKRRWPFTSFLELGVLYHPSVDQRTSLDVTIPTAELLLSADAVQTTSSFEFSYAEAKSDKQKLFRLPFAFYFFPFFVTPVEDCFVGNRSRSHCVAIEVTIDSQEEFTWMLQNITPESKIIISKMNLWLLPIDSMVIFVKTLPPFTVNVAHLLVKQKIQLEVHETVLYYLNVDDFAALMEIFPSVDELSCYVRIRNKEEFFKLVAVMNKRKFCRVNFPILQLNLEAFTDLESQSGLWHNLNLQVDELHLKLFNTDISSLRVLLTTFHDVTILKLSIEKFLTYSDFLSLPVFSIQRIIPLSKYIHLREIEISNFANPILMDDFLPLPVCKEVKLTNVALEFSSLEKLQHFANLCNQFTFKIIRFTVKVNGKEDKNELILMISMTTEKQDVKRIANQIDKSIASFEYESLGFSYFEKKANVGGVITAFSCKSLIQFCCEWNVNPVLDLDFSNLKLQCLTPHCGKCSALMVFLSLKNSDKISEFLPDKNPFSISNVSWLLNQLSLHHPSAKKYWKQVGFIKELEVIIKCHEPRSSITEILIPSLNCLRRFGIEIEELKLLVDQDDSEWSFIRLCSTEFKVNVEFKNGIEVKLPPHATESIITIECFAIAQKATDLENKLSFSVISVDQLGSPSFANQILVKCPVVVSDRKVPKSFLIGEPRIIYPADISEYETLDYIAYRNLPSNFAEKCRDAQISSIDNCAYVRVYPDETDSELIHFDCARVFGLNKLDQTKFLPFCEMKKIDLVTDENVSMEIRGNISFFTDNSAINQIEFPNPQKEVQTFKLKLIDPSMEPKCTITCGVDSSGSESSPFDFQWSAVKLIKSIPELQELFVSESQTRNTPLSLMTIDLGQLNATELDRDLKHELDPEISENNLLCEVDLLDVSIEKTSCDALSILSGKVQSLRRLNLSVEELVEAEKKTPIIPFSNLLKSSVLSPNLTSVKFSCPSNVLHIENLFQILIDSSDTHNISELHLSRVQLAWSSRSKLKQFCENLETYRAIRSDFVFSIDNSEAIVKPFNINVNLNLLMTLTMVEKSLTEALRLMESTNFQVNDQKGEQRIEKLRLEFKQSVFSTIDIVGVISAPTFEDLSTLCKLWRVKSETIHCQNLLFKGWQNETSSDLLSLLFALSNANSTGSDDLDCLFFKNSFSMTSLSYLNEFMISADIMNSVRQDGVVAANLKVEILDHESRCEFFRLQTQTLSTLKKIGISFQSVLVSVESDDTNWAHVKIALTPEKHRIQFSNDVTVTFPTNSTKEARTIAIEVHPIPDEVIKRVCAWYGSDATCHVSPVIFIDQIDDMPFLEDVCVQVPYSSSDPNVCGERHFTEAFSKQCYEQDWSLVAKKNLQKNWYTLTYSSKHFSPLSVITSALQKVFRTSDFSDVYFPNCVYLTVQTLDQKPRNVKFNCIKVQNEKEWKDLKVMTQLEYKKVGLMDRDDTLLADLAPNLCIDEFFHPEEANEKLRFFYPGADQNEQEYVMKKVMLEQEPQGRVVYYRNRAGIETRLPSHIMYLVPNLERAIVKPVLNVLRDVGCGPEDPELHGDEDANPEDNLEESLEVEEVNSDEPDLAMNLVVGPPLNPHEATGPEINPRVIFCPGMDPDGFIRSDEVSDLKKVTSIFIF